jgi:nitrogen fixation/metabolism regulation signal transduction histidine kinase
MKTLRSKIFIFVSLLLLLPALPLSLFIMQLLDKSYSIGVNERVESALDGALEISADFYQMHKMRLQSFLNHLVKDKPVSSDKTAAKITRDLPEAEYQIIKLTETDINKIIIPISTIKKFIDKKIPQIVWPAADHSKLYALAYINKDQLLQIEYPLPESFRRAASQIQEVSQIYKTLGLVRANIRRSFLYTFLIIYAGGVLIALIVSYLISKKITRPIEALTAATKEIGKGNLNYRISVTGHDEFGLLASAFNQMVKELMESQRKIIDLEKMAAWRQLARRLAHEIKNPLTPIQLMAQQMRDKYTGNDKDYKNTLNECCDIIEQEVGSLKKLVAEFSDFARMPQVQPAKQDICQLLESIQKLYRHADIKTELPAGPVEFAFDYEYMKRALINLVDNALAASKPDSPVILRLKEKENNKIEISIIDKGQGISPDNLEKIFEPYFSTKNSGVGLGLAIVKKIIEEHGGIIKVDSTINAGTEFTIILPRG